MFGAREKQAGGRNSQEARVAAVEGRAKGQGWGVCCIMPTFDKTVDVFRVTLTGPMGCSDIWLNIVFGCIHEGGSGRD